MTDLTRRIEDTQALIREHEQYWKSQNKLNDAYIQRAMLKNQLAMLEWMHDNEWYIQRSR